MQVTQQNLYAHLMIHKAKHERALKTHRYFTERWWYDWKNATPTEWETMREQLSDTWGYVGEKLP